MVASRPLMACSLSCSNNLGWLFLKPSRVRFFPGNLSSVRRSIRRLIFRSNGGVEAFDGLFAELFEQFRLVVFKTFPGEIFSGELEFDEAVNTAVDFPI